ncbi:proton/glutamate symporter [Spiroplasma clarkii]|uniref:L-cystine uptake protein TcyP n=1 Tax=Spiroplasma clarkii TaxID=2139 RepID=A0A1Y0L1U1_9MOLU|nr:dicarboxylate/amino acid:cation symporter [Spiroplasma clarkii]ARU91982.1 proton/glutamate symporter [Spiroplasma clarkii]ATX71320.1 proton/glutamate symporter [Spiroplasma clarkii]
MLANTMLRDFVGISQWQSLVAITLFIATQIGFWFFLKKIKLQFMYRVIIGFGIGLVYGIIIQAIIGFLPTEYFNGSEELGILKFSDPDSKLYWVYELNNWAQFFKRIFINGITLLTIPIVFIAIFKVTSKPGEKGVGRISIKGIALLLSNVAFAFTVTFILGYFLNAGGGLNLQPNLDGAIANNERYQAVVIPNLISGYFPTNIFATLAGSSIIPVMVISALAGSSVKILSKRKAVQMQAIRNAMDTGWDVSMSILMTFMKFMPLAVMSMITVSITSRPIGALATLGKIIGIGYLGIFISILWLTLLVRISGLKIGAWWKKAWRPLLQGFATQSSNATLPTTIDTIRNDLKISDAVTSTVAPLSTTMGLMACAGVQSGLVTSILWTGTGPGTIVHDLNIWVFFIMGLVVTLIASLGIAGIPGTATVVTVGVLGGLGFVGYVDAVLAVIAPLDGLFDMGRTGNNVLAAVAAAPIVAKSEGMIEEGSPLLNDRAIIKQNQILQLKENKYQYLDELANVTKTFEKASRNNELSATDKKDLKQKFVEQKSGFKEQYLSQKEQIKQNFSEQLSKMPTKTTKK